MRRKCLLGQFETVRSVVNEVLVILKWLVVYVARLERNWKLEKTYNLRNTGLADISNYLYL